MKNRDATQLRRRNWVASLFFALLTLPVLALLAGWLTLRASLPRLEGEMTLAGLSAPVSVARDAQGVPVIRGRSREDVARATGYVHAQERFFQMDLLRRTGAGELAALFGADLVDTDRRIRTHQFRRRALETLATLAPADRALIEAYSAGVNAGVADLGARPFEYFLLRQTPQPWAPEDSLLAIFAMWIDLQGLDARHEQRRGLLAAALPEPLYRFLTEPDPHWEAPLDGSRLPEMPIPTAAQYDLRRLDRALFAEAERMAAIDRGAAAPDSGRDVMIGSNNWAVAGARTANGGALLANDMHLGLNVPNIWYRARLVIESTGVDVTGVSLPGGPAIVAGSNGHVAWGFTNSYADFQDLVILVPGPEGEWTYLTADGPRAIESEIETIEVAGGAPVEHVVRKTIWGPIVGDDGAGRELALAWTAHREGSNDLNLLKMENARELDEAAAIIGGAGMPGQNVLIADRSGRIGWVLSGKLPRRQGFEATRPAAWHVDGAGWDGWIPASESPRLLDPPQGYAWSANARVVGGEMFATAGDGDYAPAARARQIRNRLAETAEAEPADLLAIQLDDEARYVAHWHPILVRALEHANLREAATLAAGWQGRAAVDDAAFRLLREFERRVADRAFTMLTVAARERWPDFRWRTPQRFTEVAWRLVNARPPHLLDPRFQDWDDWLADVAREVVQDLPEECANLAGCDWGVVNRASIRHALSTAVPFLSRYLDMPADALPGDWSTPRVQSPRFGASERFGVSPGRESEGYFHMPGGQSGHPLSPFYRSGHEAWVKGETRPFLPGAVEHTLTLLPELR